MDLCTTEGVVIRKNLIWLETTQFYVNMTKTSWPEIAIDKEPATAVRFQPVV